MDLRLLEGEQGVFQDIVRSIRIWAEFMKGFRTFRSLGPCVTVFGSARFAEDHVYYKLAREVGAELGRQGFAVMTGGGPGVMEAANRGAREVGAKSVGCNIHLPEEQTPNAYLDLWAEFHHFFVRKVMLVKYSRAFVLMPGGFGTLDEIFETFTLIQTGKIQNFPVVVLGRDYWKTLRPFLRDTMVTTGTIDEADLDLVYQADDPVDAVNFILKGNGKL